MENVKDNEPNEDFEKKIKDLADGLTDFSNKLYDFSNKLCIEALKSNGFEKAKLEEKINLLRGGLMLVITQLMMLKKG